MGLKDEAKIKEKIGSIECLKWVSTLVKGNGTADVSKKGDAPNKDIIEAIQKKNVDKKDIFTKNISEQKKYNIVEAVVCHAPTLFKKHVEAKTETPAVA